ncbi:MAG: TolC family protein [Rhodopirellula sp.]|nr:TolC family protein [Rhodopirellula sp.]
MDELKSSRNLSGNRPGSFAILAVLTLLAGCHSAELCDQRTIVSGEITSRFGAEIGTEREPGEAVIPPDVSTDDGLTAEEAISTALWNNAAYQAMLAQLGVTNAQLLNAGLISDPQFMLYFPVDPKVIETFGYQAVDALWLQPIRVRAAELDLNSVSETMVQNGLNVIRDVRRAHAELARTTETEIVSREAAELRREIAALAQKRLAAGDISELEATTSQIDALQAEVAAKRAVHDVSIAREQLRTLMGLGMYNDPLTPTAQSADAISVSVSGSSEVELVNAALGARPDLRAAEIAIESACERLELAKNQFMNLDAVYNGKPVGNHGFLSSPGLRFTLPVFNGNRGGIAIAEAQVQQASRQYATVRDQVTLEVRTSRTQLLQAQENLKTLRDQILPVLREAEKLARRNYENGGAPYFLVLQTTGQYLDARTRELQLVADVRQAAAELDRSVGRRITTEASVETAIELPAVPGLSDDEAGLIPTIFPVAYQADPDVDVKKLQIAKATDSQLHDADVRLLQVPQRLTRDETGTLSAVSDDDGTSRQRGANKSHQRRQDQKSRRAGSDRWKPTNQKAEHVQVTIDIRLDPRLVPSGVRTAESGAGSEDGTRED